MKRQFLLLTTVAAATIGLGAFERPTLKEVHAQRAEGRVLNTPVQMRSANDATPLTAIRQNTRVTLRGNGFNNSPHRLTATGVDLLGWMNYSTDFSMARGLYEFEPDGINLKWADAFYEENQVSLQTAWIYNNKVCGFAYQLMYGQLWNNVYVEYDLASGEIVDEFEVPLEQEDVTVVMQVAAYNEAENLIYGYGQFGSSRVFMYSESKAPEIFTKICDVPFSEFCSSLCYNKYEDSLYGINAAHEFVSIDSKGNQTVLFKLPIEDYGNYVTGLAYNPSEDKYYWNLIQADGTASMARIDVDTQTVDIYENFSAGETFAALFCMDDKLNPNRPMRPTVVGIQFVDGETDGTVSFMTPTTTLTGQAIEGSLEYTAYLDNKEYTKGEAQPGSEVEVKYVNLTDAMHTFGMTVSVDGVSSSLVSTRSYIGNDTPLAPQNVVLTDTEVTWEAVTRGVHNAYLDLEAMTYEVYINDEKVGTTKETSLPVSLPSDKPISLYSATVRAVCNGMESEMSGASNVVPAGAPMELPVYLAPTYEEFQMMTQKVIKGNGWYYVDIMEGTAVCSGQSEVQQDNWLFLPAFKAENADRLYTFSFDAFTWDDYCTEEFVEVVLCETATPDGVIATVIDEFTPTSTPTNHFGFMQVPKPGAYYVALHCTSSEWQLGVLGMNFRITDDNILPISPGTADNINVEAAPEGKLEATVSFTMPEKRINGEALSTDTELSAKVVSDVDEVIVNGKPGESVSAKVTTVQGNNKLTITVSDGETNGQPTEVEVFTGVAIPAEVSNLTGTPSADMMSVTLEWDRPTEGQDGGYINPEEVMFDIYRLEEGFAGTYWQIYAENVEGTSFTYTADPSDSQNLVQLGVGSKNIAGSNGNIVVIATVLGTPYTLPMCEEFDEAAYLGVPTYQPWLPYAPDSSYNDQQWYFWYLSYIDDGFPYDKIGLVGSTWSDNSRGMLGFPRFTTKGSEEVTLSLTVLNGPQMPKITLVGQYYGSDNFEIGTIETSDNYGLATYTFTLPSELIDKDWVQVYLMVEFETIDKLVYIDEVEVKGNNVGVEAISMTQSIIGDLGNICFKGFENCAVTISSLDGKALYNGNLDRQEVIVPMEKGIYVVKAGNRSTKVIVR
ncbi:MAG: hypothetical protein K2H47_01880 [Muribaculaceae bacterium]|nr:hypothetical protein [Muribaculaceae bacterium]